MAPRRAHQSRSQEDTAYDPRDPSPTSTPSKRTTKSSSHRSSSNNNNTYHGLGPAQRLSGISKFWHSTSGHQYFSKSWFKEMVAKDEFWRAVKGACSQTTMNKRMPSVIDDKINEKAARVEESARLANANADANRANPTRIGKKAAGEMMSSIEVDDDDVKEIGKIPATFTCADCQEDFNSDLEVFRDGYQLRICVTCAAVDLDSEEEKLPISKTRLPPPAEPEPEANVQGIPETIKIEDVENVESTEDTGTVKIDTEGPVDDCKIVEDITDSKAPEVTPEN